jgi:hypothetical protein
MEQKSDYQGKNQRIRKNNFIQVQRTTAGIELAGWWNSFIKFSLNRKLLQEFHSSLKAKGR